ncbi:hypothetical protein [Bradyrhizobium tunisiense]|uniref:hypothetical protein n=1 Tax=Bradyrhizobium tunisiense TaxID=3278709 RepID=UPI0035D83933
MIHDRSITASACRYATAANNLERVKLHMQTHLGCSPKEVAHALDLSFDQARRAVRKIRLEWQMRGRVR